MNNNIYHIINYYFYSILDGYIIEFTILNTKKSYSAADREVFKGLQGKFLKSVNLSVKMFICEKINLKDEL